MNWRYVGLIAFIITLYINSCFAKRGDGTCPMTCAGNNYICRNETCVCKPGYYEKTSIIFVSTCQKIPVCDKEGEGFVICGNKNMSCNPTNNGQDYECTCPQFMEKDVENGCKAIDYCANEKIRKTCEKKTFSVCENYFNSEEGYRCNCLQHYDDKAGKCEKIDYCKIKENIEQCDITKNRICQNNYTSDEGFYCGCAEHYIENENGTCEVLDYCAYESTRSTCEIIRPLSVCENDFNYKGGYRCNCPQHYEDKARKCQKIDYCKIKENIEKCAITKNRICQNNYTSDEGFYCGCADSYIQNENGTCDEICGEFKTRDEKGQCTYNSDSKSIVGNIRFKRSYNSISQAKDDLENSISVDLKMDATVELSECSKDISNCSIKIIIKTNSSEDTAIVSYFKEKCKDEKNNFCSEIELTIRDIKSLCPGNTSFFEEDNLICKCNKGHKAVNTTQDDNFLIENCIEEKEGNPDAGTTDPGVIAGIVIGSLALIMIIAGGAYYCMKRRQRSPPLSNHVRYSHNDEEGQFDMKSGYAANTSRGQQSRNSHQSTKYGGISNPETVSDNF